MTIISHKNVTKIDTNLELYYSKFANFAPFENKGKTKSTSKTFLNLYFQLYILKMTTQLNK